MNPEEVAAITTALTLYFEDDAAEPPASRVSGWKLAMRRPELSFDELRDMTRAAR